MKNRSKKGVSQSLEAIILVVVALSIVAVYAGWAFGVFGRTINTPILTAVGTPSIQGTSTQNPTLYLSIKNSGAAAANITQIFVNNQKVPLSSTVLIGPGAAQTLIVPLSGVTGLLPGSTVSIVVDAGQTSLPTTALVES
jgi:hypothetical protein